MPTCRDVAERASDLLDETLPWTTRLQLRMHLLMCVRCREYVRQLGLVLGVLRRLPPEEPTDAEREALIEMFRTRP
jgi:predicted anti-sigma-YlaC factor YlaD